MRTTFMSCAAPHFNQMQFLCGISHVELLGSKHEWAALQTKMREFFEIVVPLDTMMRYETEDEQYSSLEAWSNRV